MGLISTSSFLCCDPSLFPQLDKNLGEGIQNVVPFGDLSLERKGELRVSLCSHLLFFQSPQFKAGYESIIFWGGILWTPSKTRWIHGFPAHIKVDWRFILFIWYGKPGTYYQWFKRKSQKTKNFYGIKESWNELQIEKKLIFPGLGSWIRSLPDRIFAYQ